ncbi:MAG: aminoacyl-histidine dipeptidase [Clostridiales bacterium]|nr:aminoacyl-histidine dipeptidase [Clostridiales bacterium]
MKADDKVLHYFKEISKIPRASGDEGHIADYLMDFAKKRGLYAYRDKANNVIIKKPATQADSSCPPVIIQGHTDMVYIRNEDCIIPYEQGIKLIQEDGWLKAEGTTLGADNGVAVAIALALLDSKDLSHPALEAVFTASEEIGLLGAAALDYSKLEGKYVINLDTEEEGVFFTSCAGAFRNELLIPVEYESVNEGIGIDIVIGGLYGGHSGMEINEGRGNAICLLGRLLSEFPSGARLCSITAEGKMNAIPVKAEAKLVCSSEQLEEIKTLVKHMEQAFKHELSGRDEVYISLDELGKGEHKCLKEESKTRLVSAMLLLPDGVLGMSSDISGLVESSANTGVAESRDDAISFLSCVRSSVGSRKEQLRRRYAALAELCKGESICTGDYPQWEHKKHSPLREISMDCYESLFGEKARQAAVHAGLECGFFAERLEGADVISFGPNLKDVHTPKERLELSSLLRVWELTVAILERLASERV